MRHFMRASFTNLAVTVAQMREVALSITSGSSYILCMISADRFGTILSLIAHGTGGEYIRMCFAESPCMFREGE
jgi:hypothetical protein